MFFGQHVEKFASLASLYLRPLAHTRLDDFEASMFLRQRLLFGITCLLEALTNKSMLQWPAHFEIFVSYSRACQDLASWPLDDASSRIDSMESSKSCPAYLNFWIS